jgi:hypothetical protein
LNIFQAAAQYSIPGVQCGCRQSLGKNKHSIAKSTMEGFATILDKYLGATIKAIREINACGPGESLPLHVVNLRQERSCLYLFVDRYLKSKSIMTSRPHALKVVCATPMRRGYSA